MKPKKNRTTDTDVVHASTGRFTISLDGKPPAPALLHSVTLLPNGGIRMTRLLRGVPSGRRWKVSSTIRGVTSIVVTAGIQTEVAAK
jgi:hypothetical protein